MVQGSNIHPMVRQAFTDPNTNVFSPQNVISYLQSLSSQPLNQQEAWYAFEKNLKPMRMRSKYENLMSLTANVNVLESCRLNNVTRFLFASSVYVHSREGGFYRCSKQASEAYIEEYKRIYGLNYTILRYGSLYGPRTDNSNGLYRIINSALKNGVISYEGHPESMREYIHVEDAAIASVDAISDDFKNENIG